MDVIHAKARMITDTQFALDNGRNHCLISDQPSETSEGMGPTPLELCVMSHAGCYAVTVASMARKMRIPLLGLEVKVEAEKGKETGTIAEENFDILIRADASDDRIQRMHELSLEHCTVGKLYEKAGVKLIYNVRSSK